MDGAASDGYEAEFLHDLVQGLSAPQKSIPARWLYDAAGSELFDQITELSEYYPTRTEIGILTAHAAEMTAAFGEDAVLVEYGAGSALKIRLLLDAGSNISVYAPVDISTVHLEAAAERLSADYRHLIIRPITADFMDEGLGAALDGLPERRTGFFPGSTVGNLSDTQIETLLTAARTDLGEDGVFLIGLDQPKSPDVLVPAYDDAAGVTAAFNLNLLVRANRELGADFDVDAFRHRAIWNAQESRIEMHLECLRDQTVSVGGQSFRFSKGERIHTENSRKLAVDVFAALAAKSGWTVSQTWTDERAYFALVLLR